MILFWHKVTKRSTLCGANLLSESILAYLQSTYGKRCRIFYNFLSLKINTFMCRVQGGGGGGFLPVA